MDTTIFLALILGAYMGYGNACSCMREHGPEQFCHYDLIFRGTALAEYEEREDPIDHSDPFDEFSPFKDWVYTVSVDESIVMPRNLSTAKTIQFRTPTAGSMCGTRFPLDTQFIFFGIVDYDGKVTTGLCYPNSPWDALSAWQQELMTDHIADFCANDGKSVSPPEISPPQPTPPQPTPPEP